MEFTLRAMLPKDGSDILAIFQEGIETGHATFETNSPDWETWDREHLPEVRIVAEVQGRVTGWAALSAVSGRCVYGGVCEVSVYISAHARGAGQGKALLKALIKESEQAGIWTLQAGIFPENEASLALHQAVGFRVVGTRHRLGKMNHGPLQGQWRDVVLLEYRSHVVGVG